MIDIHSPGTRLAALHALALLALSAMPAFAAAPTAAQKAEFYSVCMGIAQNETLCTCKADAALTLIDSDFMTIVINSMRGKTLPVEYSVPYNTYVGQSNQICKPNY